MPLNFIDVGSPIIQAYMHGRELRRQQEQQVFEQGIQQQQQQLREAESKRQEQQLQGYLKNLQAEQEFHKSQIAQEAARNTVEALRTVGQMRAGGQIIQRAPQEQPQPGTEIPEALRGIPGMENSRLATPEEIAATQAKTIRTTGAAQAEVAGQTTGQQLLAKEPFAISEEERKRRTKQLELTQEHINKMGEIDEEAKGRLAQTNASVAGGITERNIMANAERDVANINNLMGPDMTPENWTALVEPYLYGENKTPLGNTPKDQRIRMHIAAAIPGGGQEVFNTQAAAIRNLNRGDDIYNEMAKTVKDLPTSKILANGQHQIAKSVVGTDAWNRAQQMYSMQIPLLQATGVYSARAVATEMNRLSGIMGGLPGQTQEQALANINLGRKMMRNNILDDTLGGLTDAQKVRLLLHYQQDPTSFTTNYNGHEISRYQPDKDNPGHWKVLNPQAGTYDPVDPIQ